MIYLDSSAITKLALREDESQALRDYLAENGDTAQVTSAVSLTEVPRAVARSQPLALTAVYQALDLMKRVRIDGSVLMSAASLPPLTLRSLDAIHLASALAVRKHLTAFISYDQKLVAAATFHELPAEMPS